MSVVYCRDYISFVHVSLLVIFILWSISKPVCAFAWIVSMQYVRVCSFLYDCLCFCLCYTAGKDAANDSVSGVDVFTPAVFWCYALHPDEWKEAHMGVSCLWQKSTLWTSHHWWVCTTIIEQNCTWNSFDNKDIMHKCYIWPLNAVIRF